MRRSVPLHPGRPFLKLTKMVCFGLSMFFFSPFSQFGGWFEEVFIKIYGLCPALRVGPIQDKKAAEEQAQERLKEATGSAPKGAGDQRDV